MGRRNSDEAYFEIFRHNNLFALAEVYKPDEVQRMRELASNENFSGLFQMKEISKGKFNGLVVFANLFDKPTYVVE